MKQHTETIHLRIKRGIDSPPPPVEKAERRVGIGKRMLLIDRAIRDIAVAAALLVLLIAMNNAAEGTTLQTVFSALQNDAGTQWDESLGRLSFVNSWLPQGVTEVWQPSESVPLTMPVQGELVSAWTQQQPFLELLPSSGEVHAVRSGEVMSVAHGLEEELILRLRHEDGSESLYGNLASCYVAEGDTAYEGDVIAKVLSEKPLAFEYRVDGRSVDPIPYWNDAP